MAAFRGLSAGLQVEVREVIGHPVVSSVLQVDLCDPSMLVVACRKDLRRFARKEYSGISAVAVDEPANDDHGFEVSGKLRINVWEAPLGCSSLE